MAFSWGSVIPLVGTVIDRLFPDKTAAAKAKVELLEMAQKGELAEIEAKSKVISNEANSEHWLAACWRPITMLTFVSLVVSFWFGYTPPNISEAMLLELFQLIKIGLGGYVVGRSAEKVVRVWKETEKN